MDIPTVAGEAIVEAAAMVVGGGTAGAVVVDCALSVVLLAVLSLLRALGNCAVDFEPEVVLLGICICGPAVGAGVYWDEVLAPGLFLRLL